MKVLHVANLRRFGGIQNLVSELASYQSGKQHIDAAVLAPLSRGQSDVALRVHEGDLTSGFDFSPRKLWKIYNLFRQYDLLHTHLFSPQVALCAVLSGRPIVHTEHGTFKSANQKQTWSDYVRKRLLGLAFLARFPARVVFVSEWLREDVGLEGEHCTVILNGTNAKESSARARPDRKAFRVLFAGRLVHEKRPGCLINAFARLEKEKGVLLQMVGDGPLRGELEERARRRLGEGAYAFYGYRADIGRFYAAADVVVMPSKEEPFGLVAVEAMRHEVPVLCFKDSGGVVEILKGVGDRLVVEDEQALAEAIVYWKTHPEARAAVGKKLRERASSCFTLERMAGEYLRLYRDVLAEEAA